MDGITQRVRGLLRRAPGHASHGAADVPSRIMLPRLLFLTMAFVLTVFGLLMIYSSSSILGLTSSDLGNNPAYFFVRQLAFIVAGAVLAFGMAMLDYHKLQGKWLRIILGITLALLVAVYIPAISRTTNGASRWIPIGIFTLMPSEFAKITIVLVGASICEQFFWQGSIDKDEAIKLTAVGVLLPLALILFQPDKGSTGIILATLLVMCYLAGVSGWAIVGVGTTVLVVVLAYALMDDYSRARILTMFDPFRDPYGDGYQLVQGLYAFGSGGLTGVGLGLSRQKYNYLPMAHNDFIFAVIGEELGLLGTLGVLAAFGVLCWAGFKIAQNAPDLMGRLIAAGCTSLLLIQLVLNVGGVLGVFPLSGKPVPFISYGGSSIISCLMLVGLVTSVSIRSTLPQTTHDRQRAELRVAEEPAAPDEFGSMAGNPRPRSLRLSGGAGTESLSWDASRRSAPDLRVLDGGLPSPRTKSKSNLSRGNSYGARGGTINAASRRGGSDARGRIGSTRASRRMRWDN